MRSGPGARRPWPRRVGPRLLIAPAMAFPQPRRTWRVLRRRPRLPRSRRRSSSATSAAQLVAGALPACALRKAWTKSWPRQADWQHRGRPRSRSGPPRGSKRQARPPPGWRAATLPSPSWRVRRATRTRQCRSLSASALSWASTRLLRRATSGLGAARRSGSGSSWGSSCASWRSEAVRRSWRRPTAPSPWPCWLMEPPQPRLRLGCEHRRPQS
mmetsp:Transcript_7637/g.15940  ORF Transcript_7637/g.15940 Transcript_7637/m.15940 type:complete len:214 (+) Transcript_7637:3351-3992(+)